jgi:PAS domain S-box-containing protein
MDSLRDRREGSWSPGQDLVDFLPEPAFAVDIEGRVVAWNRAIQEMTGAPAAQVLGQGNHEYSLHLFGERRRALIDHLLERGAGAGEASGGRVIEGREVALRADARFLGPVVMDARACLLRDGEGNVTGALELLRPAAVQPDAERALRASEERYRTLFEAAYDGILVLRAYTVLDCNARSLQMFGAPREELVGRATYDLSPPVQPSGRTSVEEARLKATAAQHEGPQSFEWLHRRADGSLFDAEVSLKAIEPGMDFFIAVVRDISERKRAEEALRRSEEKFSKVFEGAPESVALVRSADGAFLDVNPGFEALHGIAKKDAVGHSASELGILERFPTRKQLIDELNRSGEVRGVEVVLRHVNGARLFGLYSAKRIDVSGETCNIAIVQDITERKQMEEALRAAGRRKDEFLAMLSHELRNPLAPIRNATHVLRRLLPAEPRIQRAREIIERQLAHVSRLLDDLLDVGRITRGTIALRRERLDLRELLDQAAENARLVLQGREDDLHYVRPSQALWTDGDPARLAQVFANLLDNAAKYTSAGQRIELSARAESCPEPRVQVRVRDQGEGIAPELLPHVFELFAQGDCSLARTRGGLGIGLTLVQRLCEMHGGHVEAFSPGPGKGSEFVLALPLAGALLPAPARPPSQAPSRGAGPRVLVVDDNPDEAQSLGDLIELWGYAVKTTIDGPAALCEAADFEPDVVLLDIGLPRMDGYEVAQRLRQQGVKARLVAVTGYGRDEDRARSREAGFAEHLTKPVDPAELERILASAAESREERRA